MHLIFGSGLRTVCFGTLVLLATACADGGAARGAAHDGSLTDDSATEPSAEASAARPDQEIHDATAPAEPADATSTEPLDWGWHDAGGGAPLDAGQTYEGTSAEGTRLITWTSVGADLYTLRP
jgi:hypothetical protein